MLLGVLGYATGIQSIMPGPSSLRALSDNAGERRALDHSMPLTDGLIVILSAERPITTQEVESMVTLLTSQRGATSGKSLFGIIQSSLNNSVIDDAGLSAKSGGLQLIVAQGRTPVYESGAEYINLPAVFKQWETHNSGITVSYLSNATGEGEVLQLIERDLDTSLVFTLPLTILILIWAFRSWQAALVPIGIALGSLSASLGISALISHPLGGISATASQLIVLIVLAIGVDYSLFYLTRLREEARHLPLDAALVKTHQTTGRTIIWSGLIVTVSLLGLTLMQDTVLTSMAEVTIIAVLATLASCLYVLPAIVTLFPIIVRSHTSTEQTSNDAPYFSSLVLKAPLLSLVIVGTSLIALASTTTSMRLGNTMSPSTLPETLKTIQGYRILEQFFPDLAGGGVTVVLESDSLHELEESGTLTTLLEQLNHYGLRGPIRTDVSDDYRIHRYRFLISGTGNEPEIKDTLRRLENEGLKRIFSPHSIDAFLGGVVHYSHREIERYRNRMPFVCGIILALSFLFLLVVFESIVIPIKAILLNILSTLAAFGVMTIVFQNMPGYSWNYGIIESFVPPLLFTILFGLSMDYHVFMIARMTEEFTLHGDTHLAVSRGLQETSKSITSAALIMISVFFVAATLQLPVMKQLGVGLGAAILIDATLIRNVLLPAAMLLFGRYNWWCPRIIRSIIAPLSARMRHSR